MLLLELATIIALLSVLLWTIYWASARQLRLDWKPPLDDYEFFDRALGRLRRPYLTSDPNAPEDSFEGAVDLWVDARFPKPAWRALARPFRNLSISLEHVDVAEGLQVSLAQSRDDWKLYGPEQEAMEFSVSPRQNFVVHVRGELTQPMLVTATITATTVKGDWPLAFLARRLKVTSRLRFFVGPELGSTWVGFDPGTSGSCIAAAEHSDEIVVEKDRHGHDIITPSLVVFGSFWDKKTPPNFVDDKIPEGTYLVGRRAQADFGLPKTASFQSFKRFLGFHESIKLSFEDGDVAIEGKDLSRLLVKEVYEGFRKYLDKSKANVNLSGAPARCVVAIPNTFTLTQAAAMREVVQELGDFSEVRCLTEAEAVFFYHLSRLREIPTDRPRTVLVFDMGGSTMNATVLQFTASTVRGQCRYRVQISSRMGFSIGGDAIDYFLVRAFCRALRADMGEAFRPFDPFLKERQGAGANTELNNRWIKAAAEVKVRHATLMANRDRLTANEALLDMISDLVFKGKLEISEVGENFRKLFETEAPWPEHPIQSQPELIHGVFIPLDELVRQVIAGSGMGVRLDAVIYSGRSCRFPSIIARVRDATRKARQTPKEIVLPDKELKSAVARGCCWYGLNHSGITVSRPTTAASYGLRHTPELGKSQFAQILPVGAPFQPSRKGDDVNIVSDEIQLTPPSTFAFDNRQAVFYQVMGNTRTAFERGQKHRVTPILAVPVRDRVTHVGMTLKETDITEHTLQFESESTMTRLGDLGALQMRDYFDEHFYWFLGKSRYKLD